MSADLVIQALRDPHCTQSWDGRQWSRLLQQARAAGLLARVLQTVQDHSTQAGQGLPAGMRGHAEAAFRLSQAQQREIHREVRFLCQALADLQAPIVLLKGAAYVMAGLPAAGGRIFSDIDIMVPKAVLPQAEAMLAAKGWMSTHHSAYDQRYYRQWMHELPPMQHLQRGTTLDVHHTILPETARLRPDPARLFQAAVPLPQHPTLRVLAPLDMLLHGMTHLFMNDEMSHALRDLSDLSLLLDHFESLPDFWPELIRRAAELDLTRPLFYAQRYTSKVWGKSVPESAQRALQHLAPPRAMVALMDAIWGRVLSAPHVSTQRPGQAAALWALYVRGHWLRMPPGLLARHLAVKALGLHAAKSEGPEDPVR